MDSVQVRASINVSLAVWACLLASATANAQTDPGSLERTRPDVEAAPAPKAAPRITTPDLPPEVATGIEQTFILSAVVIDGATAFGSDELAQSFEPYLASRVGQAELNKIAQDITDRYRQAGFLLSYAVVPRQSVQSGIVHIRVVEGFVGRVRLAGAAKTAGSVSKLFQSLAAERPLRAQSLERVIELGRTVPGVIISDVQISRSAADPAQHVLTVVLRSDRFRALTYLDNRGTATNARLRSYSSFSVASLAVPGDQLQVDLFAIPYERFRYAYGQVKASAPIGSDGLRVAASASYGDSFERVAGPDQDGMSRQLTGELSYPIVKSRAFSLAGFLQLGDLRSELERAGAIVQRDRIQVARAWLDFTRVTGTRIDGRLGASQGLDLGPATDKGDPRASRPFASAKFTKFNASVQVTHPLSDRVRLRFDSIAQLSTAPLLAPEEFALGGSRIGRGFDFNEITGDHGFGGMIEIGYRLEDSKQAVRNAEIFAYVDGGGAFREHASPGLPKQRWLASAGVGARLAAFGFLWTSEAGVPLALSNGDRGVRLFFSATKIF